MVKHMLPLAAVHSSFLFPVTIFEIIGLALSLMVLMVFSVKIFSVTWFLTLVLAFLLSLMVEEDAHRQTVDLFLLSLSGLSMFLIALFSGRADLFLKHTVIGICFFRFLLVAMSLWLTLRSSSDISQSDAKGGHQSAYTCLIGYLPIFIFVYVISLGFGEGFASIIFLEATFIVDIVGELADFYPALPYAGLFLWFLCETVIWRLEHIKGYQIIWAFGGGDVLFLGLFAGYLGLPSLFALYFLSLIARVVFFFVQFFLDSKIAST